MKKIDQLSLLNSVCIVSIPCFLSIIGTLLGRYLLDGGICIDKGYGNCPGAQYEWYIFASVFVLTLPLVYLANKKFLKPDTWLFYILTIPAAIISLMFIFGV